MVQTLHQRLGNEKFAKREEKKKGRPEGVLKTKAEKKKSKLQGPLFTFVAFAVFGGLAFEFVRLIWSYFAASQGGKK